MTVYLSATQIDNFRQCPRKWAWDKIKRIPREPAKSFELGSRVHDILEAYYKGEGSPDLDEVWRFSPDSALHYPGRIASGMISEAIPAEAMPDVQAEKLFECDTLTPGIVYVGKIDVHWVKDGIINIVDHKTSTDPEKWGKKDLENDTQKMMYSAACAAVYPEADEVSFALNYGSTKLQYKKNYYVHAKQIKTKEAIEIFKAEIEPIALYMAQLKRANTEPTELPPSTDACGMFGGCPYKMHCNLTTQERMSGLMSGNSKVADLLAKAQKNKGIEKDPINPPDVARRDPNLQNIPIRPKAEEEAEIEEASQGEPEEKKTQPKPKAEQIKTPPKKQKKTAKVTSRETIFINIGELTGLALHAGIDKKYIFALRDETLDALDEL